MPCCEPAVLGVVWHYVVAKKGVWNSCRRVCRCVRIIVCKRDSVAKLVISRLKCEILLVLSILLKVDNGMLSL